MAKTTTKYIYAFLMVLILLILPYMTWYALKKGEKYLLAAAEDIRTPKDSLDHYLFVYHEDNVIDTIDEAMFLDQVVLFFHANNYDKLEQNLLKLDMQMKTATHLQFIQLYSDQNQDVKDLTNTLNLPIRNMYDLNDLSGTFSDNYLAIVDTKGKLRTYYGNEKEDFIALINHLGLLLPQIKKGH